MTISDVCVTVDDCIETANDLLIRNYAMLQLRVRIAQLSIEIRYDCFLSFVAHKVICTIYSCNALIFNLFVLICTQL